MIFIFLIFLLVSPLLMRYEKYNLKNVVGRMNNVFTNGDLEIELITLVTRMQLFRFKSSKIYGCKEHLKQLEINDWKRE